MKCRTIQKRKKLLHVRMKKQKRVSFVIPYEFVSLGKSSETTIQSKGVRNKNRASDDPGSSTLTARD